MERGVFVGDAALGVPNAQICLLFRADEGVRPYKFNLLINKIEICAIIIIDVDKAEK